MLGSRRCTRLCASVLLVFLAGTVLWKGGKSLESTWLLGGVAVLLTACVTSFSRVRASVWIPWVLYLVVSIASFAFSQTRNYGLDELIRDASVFLIFLWVVRLTDRERFNAAFAACFTAAALIAVMIGMGVYTLQPVSRFVGSFFDWRFHTDYWPNAWADLVLLAWPMALYVLRRRPVLLGISLALLWGSMILSYSRGGALALCAQILGLAICGLLMTVRRLRRIDKPLLRSILTAAVIGIAGACVLFVAINQLRSQTFSLESVSDKAAFASAEGTSSVSERRSFWNAALAMTAEKPLLGWGPYSFRFVQPVYQEAVLATADHPHNVFLKISAERGVPALLLFAFLLIAITLPAKLQILRARPGSHPLSVPWVVAALTAVFGVLVHSLIDYNLQFVGVLLPFWILLGTLVPASDGEGRTQIVVERALAVVLIIVLFIEGAFLITSSFGRHAEAAGRHADAIQWYERSRPELFSRDLLLSLAGLRAATGADEEALRVLQVFESQNRLDARAWLARGNLQEKLGRPDDARESYFHVWRYGKYNILNALSGLLRVADATGDSRFLDENREEFLELFRSYADAILRNTHFIALSATVEELQHVSPYLMRAYPDAAEEIERLTSQAATHAATERARLDERSPGLLW